MDDEVNFDEKDRIREMIMKGVQAIHVHKFKHKPALFSFDFVIDARRAMGETVAGEEYDAGEAIAMGQDTFVVGKKKKVVSDR